MPHSHPPMWLYMVKGCYSVNKQMHNISYNYNNVLSQLQHVSSLTGPPSGGAQLHERFVVELSTNTQQLNYTLEMMRRIKDCFMPMWIK